jgi:hypothetical protein
MRLRASFRMVAEHVASLVQNPPDAGVLGRILPQLIHHIGPSVVLRELSDRQRVRLTILRFSGMRKLAASAWWAVGRRVTRSEARQLGAVARFSAARLPP